MNLKDIALLNLRRRKGKAAFVLAGLITGVATMVTLIGLSTSLTQEVNHKLEKYGANILITPQNDQLSLSYEGLSLGGFAFKTQEIKEDSLAGLMDIKNAANIAAVGPIVLGAVKVRGRPALLAGVDFAKSRLLKPWWKIIGTPPTGGQVLPGAEAARILGLAPGGSLEINGRQLTVSGVLAPTGSQDDALIFTGIPQAQAILDKPGLVSMVEVAALCKDCPVEDMVSQISAKLPGAKVMAIQSVVKGRMEAIGHFRGFAFGVSALVALVGSLVVLVTMMASVKERTREIGIFRAIGFRKAQVVLVILVEAGLLSLAAGFLGYLAGMGAAHLSLPFFSQGPGAALIFEPWLFAAGMVLALLVGMCASLYPAWMASRLDPQEALRTL